MGSIMNVSLVGVGGQGTLLASEILCLAGMLSGKDVKKSEVHGMAQRGGSVVSQIRIGEKVYSPLIAVGETNLLIAFEKVEALRFSHFLAPGGFALVNDQEIRPITVSTGQSQWPADLNGMLKTTFKSFELVPALKAASELGNVKALNVVMIGALSNRLDVSDDIWRQAITKLVKPKFLDLNLKAFEAGKKVLCLTK